MRKPSLLIIFLTVFIDLIGFGIVLPLLPTYAEHYGAEGPMIGVIIGSYSLMQFFFAPFWGRLSDRIGRRPVIMLSTAGSVIAYGLFGLSAFYTGQTGLFILLGSRMFAGFCGANVSVASAYIADITTAENRSKGMGMIGMAFGLGFVLGPAIGGVSYSFFGLSGPGFVAGSICAISFLLACFKLVESRHADGSTSVQRPRWEQWKHAFGRPQLRLLMLLFFLANFCFISFEVTLPLLLGSPSVKADEFKNPQALTAAFQNPATPAQQAIVSEFARREPSFDVQAKGRPAADWLDALNHFIQIAPLHTNAVLQLDPAKPKVKGLLSEAAKNGLSSRYNRLVLEATFPGDISPQHFYFDKSQISYLFVFCGLVAAFVQGGMIGRLVKMFGEPRLVWMSLLVVAAAMVMIPNVVGMALLLLSLALFAGGSGINRAPTMGMISKSAEQHEQGAILGVAQSVGTLARIAGPVFATTAFAFQPVMPYLICASIAVLASLIAWRQLRGVA